MTDLLERIQSVLADRYAVESEVGRGGMAVVFKAEDLRHHRQVAIKVLYPELTATLGAERFLHEIEIVAGLQHPHILPLYESGEADGLLYYVMPYAEGESLRGRLDREKQLAVDESVRIAVEVADALDYAHRKGVVHRDIKPGNILLSEGHAVIADFGIARAVEAAQRERITSTGLGVGTPLYASPEQATAQETLDGRTDIYALGCVLYEMLAGEPPLTGATPQIIQARRASETPSPLHGLRGTVPPALDHVIARALARIPADRYATASQFGRAMQAALFAATPADLGELGVTPPADASPRPGSRALIGKGGSRRLWYVASALLLAGLLAVLWIVRNRIAEEPLEITTSNIRHVTNTPGIEYQPALSPDGSEVAYVTVLDSWNGYVLEKTRVEVRSTIDVGSGGITRLADSVGKRQWRPNWTRDGASVRFRAHGGPEGWMQVGSRGGSVRKLGPEANMTASWSQDESRVAFVTGDGIYSVSAAGGDSVFIGVPVGSEVHSLAWSPDGRWIAYVSGNSRWVFFHNVSNSSVWLMDTADGQSVRITDGGSKNLSPQWLPDSRHLLFVSDRDGPRQVYLVEVSREGPVGQPRVVPGPANPHSISVSQDGQRIAYAGYVAGMDIYALPIPRSGTTSLSEAVPVTVANQVIETHSVSPDGEWLAFESNMRGNFDIYRIRSSQGSPSLVADLEGNAFGPDWSPDGSEITFYAELGRNGVHERQIFVVSAVGGSPRQITSLDEGAAYPSWAPDGLSIAFRTEETTPHVWIVARDSVGSPWGEPVQLTEFPCDDPDWLPTGTGLICRAGRSITMVARDGEVLRRYEPLRSRLFAFLWPSLANDGSRIYMFGTELDGSFGLWSMTTVDGKLDKVVDLDSPSLSIAQASAFSVGPNRFYFTVDKSESDIRVADLDW